VDVRRLALLLPLCFSPTSLEDVTVESVPLAPGSSVLRRRFLLPLYRLSEHGAAPD
jgi:hypothetical protein